MYFFDRVAAMCGDLQSKFRQTAERIGGVPYLGEYLASPFWYIEHRFWRLQSYFEGVSVWADRVYNSAGEVFWDLTPYIEAKWAILTKSAYRRFLDLRLYFLHEWSILAETKQTLWTYVKDRAAWTWSILAETKESLWTYVFNRAKETWSILAETKTSVWSYVYSQAQATWSILGETKESLWVWLENNKLGAWFDASIDRSMDKFIGFVTESFGYLTTEWFKFLDRSWSSVKGSFSWLTGKLLEIVDEEIDTFKDRIWNIIERFVEKF